MALGLEGIAMLTGLLQGQLVAEKMKDEEEKQAMAERVAVAEAQTRTVAEMLQRQFQERSFALQEASFLAGQEWTRRQFEAQRRMEEFEKQMRLKQEQRVEKEEQRREQSFQWDLLKQGLDVVTFVAKTDPKLLEERFGSAEWKPIFNALGIKTEADVKKLGSSLVLPDTLKEVVDRYTPAYGKPFNPNDPAVVSILKSFGNRITPENKHLFLSALQSKHEAFQSGLKTEIEMAKRKSDIEVANRMRLAKYEAALEASQLQRRMQQQVPQLPVFSYTANFGKLDSISNFYQLADNVLQNVNRETQKAYENYKKTLKQRGVVPPPTAALLPHFAKISVAQQAERALVGMYSTQQLAFQKERINQIRSRLAENTEGALRTIGQQLAGSIRAEDFANAEVLRQKLGAIKQEISSLGVMIPELDVGFNMPISPQKAKEYGIYGRPTTLSDALMLFTIDNTSLPLQHKRQLMQSLMNIADTKPVAQTPPLPPSVGRLR